MSAPKIEGAQAEERECTKCGVRRTQEHFHRKGNRRSSRCVYCVRQEKRLYRKRLRRKRSRVIHQRNQLDCHVVGKLTPETIRDFSRVFSDFLRGEEYDS